MRPLDEILADIIAKPESDELRLEYADACESVDPRRAKYIRWHVAYQVWARTGTRAAWAPRQYQATTPPSDDNEWKVWSEPFKPHIYSSPRWHRGFPISIQASPSAFLQHGEKLFALAPIQSFYFVGHEPVPVREVMASPLLKRLFRVSIYGRFTADDFRAIAESPNLDRLLHLKFHLLPPILGREAWDILASSPSLRKVLIIDGEMPREFPGEWATDTAHAMNPHGRALEEKYGYIPWLHDADYGSFHNSYDLPFYVASGKFPIFPVGARVEGHMRYVADDKVEAPSAPSIDFPMPPDGSRLLLRVDHRETLAVLDTARGLHMPSDVSFQRTSFVAVPADWRGYPASVLATRIRPVLDALYAERNAQSQAAGDLNLMTLAEHTARIADPSEAASAARNAFHLVVLLDDGTHRRLRVTPENAAAFAALVA